MPLLLVQLLFLLPHFLLLRLQSPKYLQRRTLGHVPVEREMAGHDMLELLLLLLLLVLLLLLLVLLLLLLLILTLLLLLPVLLLLLLVQLLLDLQLDSDDTAQSWLLPWSCCSSVTLARRSCNCGFFM